MGTETAPGDGDGDGGDGGVAAAAAAQAADSGDDGDIEEADALWGKDEDQKMEHHEGQVLRVTLLVTNVGDG